MKRISLLILISLSLQACGDRENSVYPSSFFSGRLDAKCSRALPPKLNPEREGVKESDGCVAPSAPIGSFLVADARDRVLVTIPLQKDSHSDTDEITRLVYQNPKTQKVLEFKCTRIDATSLSCLPSCEMDIKNTSGSSPTPCAPVQNLKVTRNADDQGGWIFRQFTIRATCGASLTYQSVTTDDLECEEKTSSRRIDMAHFPTLDIATAP